MAWQVFNEKNLHRTFKQINNNYQHKPNLEKKKNAFCVPYVETKVQISDGLTILLVSAFDFAAQIVNPYKPLAICGRLGCIMKTCPCKVYPLKPHFYIVKLGYAGVYLSFLFLLKT